MYVKIPKGRFKHYNSKVEVIRELKKSKNVKLNKCNNDTKFVNNYIKCYSRYNVSKVKVGIYIPTYFKNNFLNIHMSFTNEQCIDSDFEFRTGDNYGVCDSPIQFLEVWDEELRSIKEKVFVCLLPVRKKDQSDWGGWRWYKWGEYIGIQTPTTEYLYDEEDIDLVYTYQIFVLKDV